MYRLDPHVLVHRNGKWVHVATIRRQEDIADHRDGKIYKKSIVFDDWSKAERIDFGIRNIVKTPYDEQYYMALDSTEQLIGDDIVITYNVHPRFDMAELATEKKLQLENAAAELLEFLSNARVLALENPGTPIETKVTNWRNRIDKAITDGEAAIDAAPDYETLVALDPAATLPAVDRDKLKTNLVRLKKRLLKP